MFGNLFGLGKPQIEYAPAVEGGLPLTVNIRRTETGPITMANYSLSPQIWEFVGTSGTDANGGDFKGGFYYLRKLDGVDTPSIEITHSISPQGIGRMSQSTSEMQYRESYYKDGLDSDHKLSTSSAYTSSYKEKKVQRIWTEYFVTSGGQQIELVCADSLFLGIKTRVAYRDCLNTVIYINYTNHESVWLPDTWNDLKNTIKIDGTYEALDMAKLGVDRSVQQGPYTLS